jgi:hypothetical protein
VNPKLLALAVALVLPALPVQAQELPIPPGAFKGFDTVMSDCIILTPEKFAPSICERLSQKTSELAAGKGIAHVHLGDQTWHGEDYDARSHIQPDGATNDSAKPVRLTFFVRGTAGSPAGAFIQAAFWVPFEGEAGGTPRSGKLVLWERSSMATGPRKKTPPFLSDHIIKQLDRPFAAFATDNTAR